MTTLFSKIRIAIANRRAYHRAVAEIEQLDIRELNDMGVDRDTLVAGAFREIYGAAR